MSEHGEDSDGEVEDAIVLMPGHELVTCCVFAGAQRGYVDGPIADARFHGPTALLQLSDGGLLVSDRHRLRKISADDVQQQVSTIAGEDEGGHRDGAPAQARFGAARGFLLLPDGRVLVADCWNHRIRLLSADLLEVSTVAGDGTQGHRDGAAAKASLHLPRNLVVLRDGRVLVLTCQGVRVLSADFQQVHAVAPRGVNLWGAVQRFDGSVVISFCGGHLCVLDGFEARLTKRRRTCVTDT